MARTRKQHPLSPRDHEVYDQPGIAPSTPTPKSDHARTVSSGAGAAQENIDRALANNDALNQELQDSLAQPDTAAEAEQAKLNDRVGRGYRPEKEVRQGRFPQIKVSRRRAAATGGAVAGIAGLFWGLSIVQGPFQLIHMAQLLQQFHYSENEDMGDGRAGRLLRNLSNGNLGAARTRSRMGRIMNPVADKIELRFQRETGLRNVYDSVTGRWRGWEVINRNKSIGFLSELDFKEGTDIPIHDTRPPDVVAIGPNGEVLPASGLPMLDAGDFSYRERKKFIAITMEGLSLSKIPGAAAFRIMIRRAGLDNLLHPFKFIVRKAEDSLVQYYRERQRERAADLDKGNEGSGAHAATADDDPDGDGENSPDPNAERAAAEAEEAVSETAAVKPAEEESSRLIAALESKMVTRLQNAEAAVGILCTVRTLGNEAEKLQYLNTILPLLRMGATIVAAGSQAMWGKGLTSDEMGALVITLYDESKDMDWSAARSIQAELGQRQTGPDIPGSAKPSKVGVKPLAFQVIDRIPFIGTACGVDDAVGNLPVIKQYGQVTSAGLNIALSVFGVSIEDFAGAIVRLLAGNGVNLFARGPELGNYANYGTLLAANDNAIGMGGRRLSAAQAAELKADAQETLRFEQQRKSVAKRMFDVYDANSMVASLMREAPRSPTDAVASIFSAPGRLFSMIFTSANAQSATNNYDYGIDMYGFSREEQNDDRFDNPYENAQIVEDQIGLEEMNEEYGDCFSMKIDPDTGGLINGDTKRYDEIPDKCHHDENNDGIEDNENLLRYRFYIADMVTTHSVACYEGEEESCNQLIYGTDENQAGGGNAPPLQGGGGRGQDTSNRQCTAGTDAGLGDTPDPAIKIRLCEVYGVRMNVLIEGNYKAAVDGARAAGITLGASNAYRSHQEQIDLRRAHCGTSNYDIYDAPSSSCSPPTARPGSSMHEWGLAVDFTCNGGDVTRGGPCFQWMDSHQNVHFLVNLPSEPWHWSTTGQ